MRKNPYKTTARDRLVRDARRAVTRAIEAGDLPQLSTLTCIDCGEPAECYDHRDYNQPLIVDAVCIGCNNRRGPGFPLPTKADGSANKLGIDGGSGTRWDSVEGGEGYEPLAARLHMDAGIALEQSAEKLVYSVEREENLRIRKLFYKTAKDRDDFFKSHDPRAV